MISQFIRAFLRRQTSIDSLIESTDNGHPALEGLQNALINEFGNGCRERGWKTQIGRITREIMDENGYDHLVHGVPCQGTLFTKASTYIRR